MPAALSSKMDQAQSPAAISEPPAPRRPGWAKAALIAIAVFALINATLWAVAGRDKPTSSDLWSGSGSIDLALADLAALKERPSVVLLGSSLMMYPFWAMDKEAEPGIPDIFHHHVSNTLERALSAAGWKHPVVFSLAIFGQMASDAYIYVDEFLRDGKRPDWLIFGIAPRDFSDHDVPAPMATMTFKRLVSLANFPKYADLYLPGWQDKADFVAAHACFFYGRRWRLQHEVDKALEKIYLMCGIQMQAPAKPAAEERAGFMLAGSEEERWKNSLSEYRRRYRNIEGKSLEIQMGFLSRLLKTCRERGIKVIVVNMPLTDVNRALLPDGFYRSFCRRLAEMTDKPGVYLLDLGDSRQFVHADFWDTTHLNHAGGHKLVQEIMPILTGRIGRDRGGPSAKPAPELARFCQ